MQILKILTLSLASLLLLFNRAQCQVPTRIEGMTPSKWIIVKHTISPGRALQQNGQSYVADFEDIHAKIWVPLIFARRLKVAAGVSYRTEQVEKKGLSNAEFSKVDHWNLRSTGLDLKTVTQLSQHNSLMVSSNLSHSATVQSAPLKSSPLNFSVSAIFMQRKSDTKESGFGLLHSTASHFPFLPIIVWNETFNKRNGIEICLPYKMAWRHNLSATDILHFKAEGTSRNYFIAQPTIHQCRRLDLDLGVAYTKFINKWIGLEFFGGFRQNISSEMPNDISLRTGSGFAFSTELFVVPAFKSDKVKK